MQCQTVLPGTECTFWTKSGCSYTTGSCENVVADCEGCERIVEGTIGKVCSLAPSPTHKWAAGMCNFATHRRIEIKTEELKINPLKASKKAAGGKKK